jgi:hypothetical protein
MSSRLPPPPIDGGCGLWSYARSEDSFLVVQSKEVGFHDDDDDGMTISTKISSACLRPDGRAMTMNLLFISLHPANTYYYSRDTYNISYYAELLLIGRQKYPIWILSH